jgi:2-keto-3-deoxy-L-rhamnonate aldolase RhmA
VAVVHISTQTILRTTQTKKYIEQHIIDAKRYIEQHNVYPGICLTTEEKARKNLSQGCWRMPVGTMKTEYTEQSTEYTEQSKNT